MLRARGLVGAPTGSSRLVQHYSGNPSALKLVAETIQSIFAGDIGAFLQAETLVFDDIRDVLDQQFARLSPLERELMVWLAIVREPVPFPCLRDLLAQPPAPRRAVWRPCARSSAARCWKNMRTGFGLQNVVLEYCSATAHRNDQSRADRRLRRQSGHANRGVVPQPLRAGAGSVQRICARQSDPPAAPAGCGATGEGSLAALGQQRRLQEVLAGLRTTAPTQGYAAANLLHLLLHLEADLRGVDCSGLVFRQLLLRGVSLPEAQFRRGDADR